MLGLTEIILHPTFYYQHTELGKGPSTNYEHTNCSPKL